MPTPDHLCTCLPQIPTVHEPLPFPSPLFQVCVACYHWQNTSTFDTCYHWQNTSTFDTWTCPVHSTVPSAMQGLQWLLGDFWTLLFVIIAHSSPLLLLSAPLKVLTNVNMTVPGRVRRVTSSYRIISRTTQHVRERTSSCSCAGGG